jgi:enoyl-CoA hydratase/carnithine racemase
MPSLRCIVLRGAGDRAFAAGADISEFHAERANSKQAQAYSEGGIGWLRAIAECRHPTLALIQGACVGGGLLVASQCDLRICNESARFGVPVKNLGLTESYDELAGMLRILGPSASLEILLEGRIWGAREAYEKGLVSRVVPDADVSRRPTRRRAASPKARRSSRAGTRSSSGGLLDPRPLSDEERAEGYACFDTEDFRAESRHSSPSANPTFTGK